MVPPAESHIFPASVLQPPLPVIFKQSSGFYMNPASFLILGPPGRGGGSQNGPENFLTVLIQLLRKNAKSACPPGVPKSLGAWAPPGPPPLGVLKRSLLGCGLGGVQYSMVFVYWGVVFSFIGPCCQRGSISHLRRQLRPREGRVARIRWLKAFEAHFAPFIIFKATQFPAPCL